MSLETYMASLNESRLNNSRISESGSSISSEDEQRIENEIKRHNSED